MEIYEAGQTILNNVLEYMNWGTTPTAAPCPITIAHKWEGPLLYFLDNLSSATYPVVVLLPSYWPDIEGYDIHQGRAIYKGDITFMYKASAGENAFQKAREGMSKIVTNLIESPKKSLNLPTLISKVEMGGIRCPSSDFDVHEFLFGMKIATASASIRIESTIVF